MATNMKRAAVALRIIWRWCSFKVPKGPFMASHKWKLAFWKKKKNELVQNLAAALMVRNLCRVCVGV